MNLILRQNVLMYFNKVLQNKVKQLFFDSFISVGIPAWELKNLQQSDFGEKHT